MLINVASLVDGGDDARGAAGFPALPATPLWAALIAVGNILVGLWIRVLFVGQPTPWVVKLGGWLSEASGFYTFIAVFCLLSQANILPVFWRVLVTAICGIFVTNVTEYLVSLMEKHFEEVDP